MWCCGAFKLAVRLLILQNGKWCRAANVFPVKDALLAWLLLINFWLLCIFIVIETSIPDLLDYFWILELFIHRILLLFFHQESILYGHFLFYLNQLLFFLPKTPGSWSHAHSLNYSFSKDQILHNHLLKHQFQWDCSILILTNWNFELDFKAHNLKKLEI